MNVVAVVVGFDELSEIDQRIIELNHQGYSTGGISKLLKAQGIELNKTSIARHLRELRQDADNMIQNNYKSTSGKPKEDGKWYKIVERLLTYFPEYQKTWGVKPSVRTAFYDFQDLHLVTKNDANMFGQMTAKARLGWVDENGNLYYPKIPIDAFSDEKDHSETVGTYGNYPPIEPQPPENPHEYIQDLISEVRQAEEELETAQQEAEENLEETRGQLFDGPDNYEGIGTSGIRGGMWYNQPEYVEVWEEKVDLVGNFEQLLTGWQIKIRGNGGYPSLLFLNKCCVELKEVIEKNNIEPEHIHIKYCGDWDPSGLGIDYYIKKRLRQLGISGIDFERIAVLHEHITQFNLPLMNIKKDPNKKKPNPNLAEFKRLYGEKATHLNAFMTLKHKKDFMKILDNAITKHWDKKIYDDMIEEYEGEPKVIDDLDGVRETMRREIEDAGYD